MRALRLQMGGGGLRPPKPPFLKPCLPSTPLLFAAVQAFFRRHVSLFETRHVSIVFAIGGRPLSPSAYENTVQPEVFLGGGGGCAPPMPPAPLFGLSRGRAPRACFIQPLSH